MEDINKTGCIDLIQKPEWALGVSAAWFVAHPATSASGVLGWLRRQRLTLEKWGWINVTGVNERMRQLHLQDGWMHGWMESCGGDQAEGHSRDQHTVGFAPCALQYHRGDSQLWWAASSWVGHSLPCRHESWHPTSPWCHTRSWLLLSPAVYYVGHTEARSVNRESDVRTRHEWKQIFFKRLLDIARFINLLLKFSCQNNIWLKRVVL